MYPSFDHQGVRVHPVRDREKWVDMKQTQIESEEERHKNDQPP
jgi:hypothetical protein